MSGDSTIPSSVLLTLLSSSPNELIFTLISHLPTFLSRLALHSAEMDAETNVEPHGALMRLYRQINDCESWLLHQDALERLGIRANRVALMDDESLQFVPCFFWPYSGKILPMCYLNGVLDQDDLRRNNGSSTLPENPFPKNRLPTNQRPEFEAILKEAQKENPDGDYLGAANCRYHSDLWMWSGRECEMDVRARELWDYLQRFVETSPEVQSDSLTDNTLHTLRDLEKLESWE